MCRSLTFEEYKFALAVLIDGVDLWWQTSPEDIHEHGVTGHHSVISDPPKPVVLHREKIQTTIKIKKQLNGTSVISHKALHVFFLEHIVVNTKL